jgi:large subunit ribosomal protein L17
MRHRSTSKKLNRDTKSRKALFRGLVRSLVETGSIVTTEVKAKEIKRIADKLIGKAKTDSLETRRNLHKFFGVRDVVNTLVEKIAPEFSDRVSGFTRVTKLGVRRGDNTPMAKLSLIKMPQEIGTLKNKAEKKTKVKAKPKVTPAKKKEVVKKTAMQRKKSLLKKLPKRRLNNHAKNIYSKN